MFKPPFVILSFLLNIYLQATILEIHQIEDIKPYVTEDALLLFDIDDTLIDNPFSLGSSPWRNWVKPKISSLHASFNFYDALTLYIAKSAPYKPVETSTPSLITELQLQGHTVLAFTARGRSQWYSTNVDGVDQFTYAQLCNVGIDFQKTLLPPQMHTLEGKHFYQGIIFAQHIEKGVLLKHLFKDLTYQPSAIIFVDDRLEQVQSVVAAGQELGIPTIGFWYRRSEWENRNFDPSLTNMQLESLLRTGEILSDEKALQSLKQLPYNSPEEHLTHIIEEAGMELFSPLLLDCAPL